jgi:hypothetical protein
MKKRFPKLYYSNETQLVQAEDGSAVADMVVHPANCRIPKYKLARADKYGPEIVRRWNLVAEQEAKCSQ